MVVVNNAINYINGVNLINGVTVERKEIQEQRMKSYFVEATKEILKGEGLRSISVRNIAERAGYSYATLYNYFTDAKSLVFECVKDFQEECEESVKKETEKIPDGIEKIKAIAKTYIKYFVQYPGTFDLFFIERINNLEGKQPTIELVNTFLDRLCEDQWNYCIANDILKAGEAEMMKMQLRFFVPGLLMLYINRRHPATYKEFTEVTDKQLNRILSIV